ncbi:hypothetical protein OH492_25070 [Vibrio chagasii]|nr:hypothetical protein [Vibrio chagasii]
MPPDDAQAGVFRHFARIHAVTRHDDRRVISWAALTSAVIVSVPPFPSLATTSEAIIAVVIFVWRVVQLPSSSTTTVPLDGSGAFGGFNGCSNSGAEMLPLTGVSSSSSYIMLSPKWVAIASVMSGVSLTGLTPTF